MKLSYWIKTFPLTAVMIVCWIIGGAYFGSTKLYNSVESYRNAPQLVDSLASFTTKSKESVGQAKAIISVGVQKTTEDKEAAEKAAAEEERKKHPFSTVDQSYLDDAVFIGDSRTDTLRLYADWKNATYYVKTGTNIWSIMSDEVTVGKKTMTIDQALQKNKFAKVYIMLGVNELGSGTAESFYQQFKTVVERIEELQPDAIIFVESIMHVTQSVSSSSKSITNDAINSRNKLLKKLANNENIYFIDENEALDDDTGALTAKYTFDGIHLQAQYVQPWKDFILAHGVVLDK